MLLLQNDNCKHTNLFQSVIKVIMDKDVRLNAENVLTKRIAVASMGCLPGYQRDTCKQREIVV